MRIRALGLAVCLLLIMAGCGKSGSDDPVAVTGDSIKPSAQQAEEVLAQPRDVGNKTAVKLLEPGSEPRTALRYKFQANQSEDMIMELSMAMAMEIGDQKQPETEMPVTRMTMKIDSNEVSPEGDLHYEFVLDQVEVLPNPGGNPMMADAMKQQMSGMTGISGSATVSSRGFTKEAVINPPPALNPQLSQMLGNMEQSIKQMSAPLPEEPVGIGARWEVAMEVDTPVVTVMQTATYTITEMKGDTAKFDVSITQSAPAQEIEPPGAIPGMKVSMESLDTTGTGTVELWLANLVPTSDMSLTTTNVVSANSQKMKTTMRMGMKIHP